MNTPYTELSRVAVEAATRLSRLSLDSAERVIALQLGYAKESLASAVRNAQSAAGAKDVQELLALRALAAESAMERFVGYSRSLYDVAADAQSGLAKIAGSQATGYADASVKAQPRAKKK